MVEYKLLNAINQSKLSSHKSCRILGLNPDRFHRWKALYRSFGLNGLADKPPLAKNVSNRLLPEEEGTIFQYANEYPQQHYREIKFNLEKQDIYISTSTVYRRLKEKELIKEHKILKPKKTLGQARSNHTSSTLAGGFNLYPHRQGLLVSYSHYRPLFALYRRLGIISLLYNQGCSENNRFHPG